MRAQPSSELLSLLLPCAFLAGFTALLCLQDIRSLDYWWHLKTGQWIAEHGRVPTADIYTYTVRGAQWIDSHWLHQITTWGAYRLGGHAGVVVWKLALVAAAFALIAPIGWRRDRAFVSVALLACGLIVCSTRFLARPELPSFVALAAGIRLLERFASRETAPDSWLWLLVPVQLVWTNFHGLFAVGIGLCGLYLLAELARPLLVRGSQLDRSRVVLLASVTAGCMLVTLLNPNGLDLPMQTLDQLRMVGPTAQRGLLGQAVGELQPTLTTDRPERPLFLALAAISLLGFALGRRAVRTSDVLAWIAFAILAAGAIRNVPLFALVVVPMGVRHWNAALDAFSLPKQLPAAAGVALSLLLAVLIVDVARDRYYLRLGAPRTLGLGIADHFNPVGAADWIDEHRPAGPIAHLMNEGGYFIWRFHPEYPVLVDGRLEVFGPRRFAALHIGTPERFAALDETLHFGIVHVLHGHGHLHTMLRYWWQHEDWKLVYADDVSALFVRTPNDFPALDPAEPGLFTTLEASHPSDQRRLIARARFYDAVGLPRAALAVWNEARDRFPNLDPQGTARDQFIERLFQLPADAAKELAPLPD